ncbi:MAG: hypothetical protein AB7P49_15705 [Bdellovibrionales bacterium]
MKSLILTIAFLMAPLSLPSSASDWDMSCLKYYHSYCLGIYPSHQEFCLKWAKEQCHSRSYSEPVYTLDQICRNKSATAYNKCYYGSPGGGAGKDFFCSYEAEDVELLCLLQGRQ